MLDFINKFAHKAEIRESKDEILIGEMVRAMNRMGFPAISFGADGDRQRVRFLAVQDPLLYSIYIVLDRKTGSGMLSEALLGSKATLKLTAEVKNRISDPDDLLKMFHTDLANMFKMPVIGGIKLNHELNSVYASETQIIEIENYVLKGEAGNQAMVALLQQRIAVLREKLVPYKKG